MRHLANVKKLKNKSQDIQGVDYFCVGQGCKVFMMNSLFRSMVSNKQRDIYFKNEIVKELNHYIKEIQTFSPHSQQGKQTTNEVTNALCTSLEALFLHGLRETILSKMSAMTSDIIKKPECNFWPVVLIFSHQEIISNINKLKLITNDIGRCRAWLRLALNDSLLVSYLSMMRSEPKSLTAFYNKSALLRDTEKLDIVVNLLQGIMQYEFQLAINSSLLNIWSDDALILAGVWSPPMKADSPKGPLSSGIDVAQTIKDDIEDSLGSVLSLTSLPSIAASSNIDEEAYFRTILQLDDSSSKNKTNTLTETTEDSVADLNTDKSNIDNQNPETLRESKSNHDNSDPKQANEKEFNENEIVANSVVKEKVESKQRAFDNLNSADNISFTTVLKIYNEGNQQSMEDIENGYNIDEIIKGFQDKHQTTVPEAPVAPTPSETIYDDQVGDFEVVHSSQSPLDMPEFSHFTACLSKLTREQGLRFQNYSCKQCLSPIGMNFSFLCGYTSEYFCEDCFGPMTSVIPSRIVYNWDFSPRPVSRHASAFLSEIHNHPVFNVKLLNPRLYLLVDQMTQVHYMRMKLNFIKFYLLSCKTTANYLQVELWPREYLYDCLHLYSLLDLKEIRAGKLQILLEHVIGFGVKHISSCTLCKMKGHICEFCKDSEVLFPFDLVKTHTCRVCRATFHKACYKGECPKCCRIQKRKSASNLALDDHEDCVEISEEDSERKNDESEKRIIREESQKDDKSVESETLAIITNETTRGAKGSDEINMTYDKSNIKDSESIINYDKSSTNYYNNSLVVNSSENVDSDNEDNVSLDGEPPQQIECIAEVHSVGSR